LDPVYNNNTPAQTAAAILAGIQALPKRNTPNTRAVRCEYTRKLRNAPANFILSLSREILKTPGYRGVAYELIGEHKGAFNSLDDTLVEELGQGINSWWTVDSFGRTISGPAWLAGHIPDHLIQRWAQSEDLWWRRAALVSTVALNTRSQEGYGDTNRTLAICQKLANDQEDMVVKALSWALRELVPHDSQAVEAFLAKHEKTLAARVKREVRNKLRTGLKNPRKSST
jgi:3-methyladenine DNA glycosylase AlkD